ncbi:hypothetical protein LK07_28810 [Streptomyces pluripotens]|uniref:Uncharacterized protein n=1 Tax=Streptomyces pluripotens TaxID=1355015 RepID=A0A221P5I4_9ACTN|nr:MULTISPECIES: hypothetical protein [Streptomyces]ARP73123.1 hypothetical protein LK06_027640 [Streptomyces pluripotens]ASN27374.1 hypothetical protein LK07_28810 [Streptomyces pluripotens]KIE28654.1 hypothetical protein LK08_01010 [Streptomyces sp. MUSC 125]MCH0558109.1 hypothetical protein [Streptomyces sp. MUM 16J]
MTDTKATDTIQTPTQERREHTVDEREHAVDESERTPAEEALAATAAEESADGDEGNRGGRDAARRRSRILAGLTVGACVLGAGATGPITTVVSIR